jgi:hypothetical protein
MAMIIAVKSVIKNIIDYADTHPSLLVGRGVPIWNTAVVQKLL